MAGPSCVTAQDLAGRPPGQAPQCRRLAPCPATQAHACRLHKQDGSPAPGLLGLQALPSADTPVSQERGAEVGQTGWLRALSPLGICSDAPLPASARRPRSPQPVRCWSQPPVQPHQWEADWTPDHQQPLTIEPCPRSSQLALPPCLCTFTLLGACFCLPGQQAPHLFCPPQQPPGLFWVCTSRG